MSRRMTWVGSGCLAALLFSVALSGCSELKSPAPGSAAESIDTRRDDSATRPASTPASTPVDRPATPSTPLTMASAPIAVPVNEACDRVLQATRTFELIRCDEHPTVRVDGHQGYRIVLRYSEKAAAALRAQERRAAGEQPQGGTGIVSNIGAISPRFQWHLDLVLFPEGKVVPGDIASRIPWEDLEQSSYTKSVYMGSGSGHHWYARTSVPLQDSLRTELGLSGGDDSIEIVIEGLRKQAFPRLTEYDCADILRRAGADAVPRIVAGVRDNPDGHNARLVYVLRFVEGDESTRALLAFYGSDDSRLVDAAESALVASFRQQAKEAYLDMLRRQRSVTWIAPACADNRWQDAVPLLAMICGSPRSLVDFRSAYWAKRELEGRPLPKDLSDVERAITDWAWQSDTSDETTLQKATETLLDATDVDAAAVAGIALAVFVNKVPLERSERVNRIGRKILESLPADAVEPVVRALPWSITDEQTREHCIEKLGEAWGPRRPQ
jgi:hypothetical protein